MKMIYTNEKRCHVFIKQTILLQHINDIEAYEVYNKKIAIEEDAPLPAGNAVGGLSPLTTADGILPSATYSLLNLLYFVKHLNNDLYITASIGVNLQLHYNSTYLPN